MQCKKIARERFSAIIVLLRGEVAELAYRTALEMRSPGNRTVSSNLTLSVMLKVNWQDWFPDRKWKPFAVTILLGIMGSLVSTFLAFQHDQNILKFTARPRLAFDFIKFEENNSYIKARQTEKGAEIKFRLGISNNGESYARNITIPSGYYNQTEALHNQGAAKLINTISPVLISPSGLFSLAPQEKRTVELTVDAPLFDKRAAIDLTEAVTRKLNVEFPLELKLSYECEPELNCGINQFDLSLVYRPSWVDVTLSTPDSNK